MSSMTEEKHSFEPVTLITTERNEVDAIEEFIASALNQTLKPDELIIADGGSTDGTIELIQKFIDNGAPIKLIHAPGNRSIGRNAATEASSNSIIACSDVGSRLDPNWLKNITEPFRKNPKAMAVAGHYLPDPKSFFEDVSATLLVQPRSAINLDTWLPSSRSVAYRKEAWKKAGGYPVYTNFNEDTPYDLALKNAGFKFENGLDAIVYWRPRPNLKEYYKQYYFYAVGDALDNIGRDRILKITAEYVIFTILILGMFFIQPIASLALILIWSLRQARRIYGPWKKYKSIKAFFLLVLLIIVYDISQVRGFWHGKANLNKLRNSAKLVR